MDKIISKRESSLRSKLKTINSLIFAKKEDDGDPITIEKKQLLSDIEQALADLRYARSCFEDARDPEMIEACVYEIKSAEARYSFLLRKAKLMASYTSKISV